MISSEQSNYLKIGVLKMVKVADLSSFDMAESLKTEEDIVMYLNMVLEENNPAELAHALSVIAKARVMTQIAK
jgi:probable addiction module antidote protein